MPPVRNWSSGTPTWWFQPTTPRTGEFRKLIRGYILKNFIPDPKTGLRTPGHGPALSGDDAVRKVRAVVGNIAPERRSGETIP